MTMQPNGHDQSLRRVALITGEMLGAVKNGGLGTAMSYLAIALARAGRQAEILCTAPPPAGGLERRWSDLYEREGVAIRYALPSPRHIDPRQLAVPLAVSDALRDDPPSIAIAQDWGGPAYVAQMLRVSGRAFDRTAFVIVGHGPSRWIAEAHGKLPGSVGRIVLGVLERASVEHADVLVTTNEYMRAWMRGHGWLLPKISPTLPNITRSVALGEPPERATLSGRVRRLAYFGRIEERKGVGPFIDGLNSLDPALLNDVTLLFLGSTTPRWTEARVLRSISAPIRAALTEVRIESELDHDEAIAELLVPNTAAVVPSLLDNSPCTVAECIEHGVPIIASATGGIPELVHPVDRGSILFPPTPAGVHDALTNLLTSEAPVVARPSPATATALAGWLDLTRSPGPCGARERDQCSRSIGVVVRQRGSADALESCLDAVAQQTVSADEVVVATQSASRTRADSTAPRYVVGDRLAVARSLSTELVWLLDEKDLPDPELLEALVRAQTATNAGAVTVACRVSGETGSDRAFFFLGGAGGLGLGRNLYGVAPLVDGDLLKALPPELDAAEDPDWPLLARLGLGDHVTISIPETLLQRANEPSSASTDPAAALATLHAFEGGLPGGLYNLGALALALQASGWANAKAESETMMGRFLRARLRRQRPSSR